MGDDTELDPARLMTLLRDDPLVRDAELMPGDDPAELTVLIVPQGWTPGHAVRELVMRLAGPAAERAQVVLAFAIPRDDAGNLDLEEAWAAADQPGALFRFVPPESEVERSLADLVREVLTDVRIASMTDSLVALGCDSVSSVEIATRIREQYGKEIDPHELFGAESLRQVAALLADESAGSVTR